MDDNEERPAVKKLKKYSITVLNSEPQIIDSKLTFYVKDFSPSKRKSTSDNQLIVRKRSKSKCEYVEMDDKITQAIKEQLTFDSVYHNLFLHKDLKEDKGVEKKN